MKSIKKSLLFVFLITIVLLAIPTQASAAVKISKKSVTLIKGQSVTLKVTGTKSKAKWSSSKKSIATVSSKGKVVAKKKGSAIITAKIGEKKYTCKINVETPKINKSNLKLEVGENANLKINGTSQKIKWKSSNKKIATVNSKGLVKGIKEGNCKITATVNRKKYNCTINVYKGKNMAQTETDKRTEAEKLVETEKQTELEKQTESEKKVETEKQTEKQTEAEIQTEAETEKKLETETEPATEAESEQETEEETEVQTESELQTESETEKQMETEKQTETETEKQTETETEKESETEPKENNLVVSLDNDYESVVFDSSTDVEFPISIHAETKVFVYYCGLNITNLQAWPPENGVQYEITETHGIEGIWDSSTHTYTATQLLDETGYVDITVTFNEISKTKRFTVATLVL